MSLDHQTKRTHNTLSHMTRSMALLAYGMSHGRVSEIMRAEISTAEEIEQRTADYRARGIIGANWRYGRNSKNHGPRSAGCNKRRRARRFARAHGRRIGA